MRIEGLRHHHLSKAITHHHPRCQLLLEKDGFEQPKRQHESRQLSQMTILYCNYSSFEAIYEAHSIRGWGKTGGWSNCRWSDQGRDKVQLLLLESSAPA